MSPGGNTGLAKDGGAHKGGWSREHVYGVLARMVVPTRVVRVGSTFTREVCGRGRSRGNWPQN